MLDTLNERRIRIIAMDLAQMTCIPCQGGVPPLTREEIKTYQAALGAGGWKVMFDMPRAGRLLRSYEFDDFAALMKFVNKVADLAEENGHHPNFRIHDWNKLELELFTHKIGGLSEADF